MDETIKPFQNDSDDFKNQILKIIPFWKLILVCVAVAFVFAFSYNKLTLPTYEVHTTILVKKENSKLDRLGSSVYDAVNDQSMIQDEIGILKSMQLTERAVERLNPRVSYYSHKRFNYEELYRDCPFRIITDSLHKQIVDVFFKVEIISPDEFRLSINSSGAVLYDIQTNSELGLINNLKFSIKGNLNKFIETSYFKLKLEPLADSILGNYKSQKFYFVLNSKERLISSFHNFEVTDFKSSSIISVSMQGNNIEKMVDYLNTLAEVYLEKSVEKKHLISDNTIRFIDSQLGGISDSLKFSAEQLQNFQSKNKVLNIDYNAQQIMQNIEELQKQRAELMLQKKYFEYIKEFINNNHQIDDFVPPGAIGVNDQVITGLLSELLQQQGERNELTMNLKKENPFLKSVDLKIENKKRLILENIRTLIEANKISMKEINDRIGSFSDKASALPKTQGKLFGYERLFKLNDDLYTYLLTKRSETQISKASLLPDNEVLDKAHRRSAVLIAPKKGRSLLMALLLGLGIPILIIYTFDYFNDKIHSIKDVEDLTDFPLLGCVVHGKNTEINAVLHSPNSLIAESLRSIRANLQFLLTQNEKHIILITSSITDEGKSFVSNCLASSFAMFEKRTILLCFDLRKPLRSVLYEREGSQSGLSTFLSGNCQLNDIIMPTDNKNLQIILPGPLPPNPNELIASSKTETLFSELKKNYDYIIIDTPPVGLIADALLLLKHVDLNLFVVRHNRTSRNLLVHICNMYRKKNINNIALVVNDIPLLKNNYMYGYNYYGYGYNYYNGNSEGKKTWLERINIFNG